MQAIYVPKGRALEYSPLALNIYSGCDHACKYCYCLNWDREWHNKKVQPKDDILKKVERDAQRIRGSKDQVLLCFAGDAYCRAEEQFDLTPKVLRILRKNLIPTAILSKGGRRMLKDLDMMKSFGDHIKVGASLTFDNEEESRKFEPGAAIPEDRIETLKILALAGIRVWVSLEPVICTDQVKNLIERTHAFVHHYKVGMLNYFRLGSRRSDRYSEVFELLRKHGSKFYVKEDLQLRIEKEGTIDLMPEEIDRTRFGVAPFAEEQVGLGV